jgi:hypothetical protein
MTKGRKIIWAIVVILVLSLVALIYFKYFFVFGEGVKTGHLNYAVKKGNVFKTYEGKLIQAGFKSPTAGSIQSYEFEFSIKNKHVFEMLERNSGKSFDLHYKEYHGVVPWRGNTVYIVDSVIAMRNE